MDRAPRRCDSAALPPASNLDVCVQDLVLNMNARTVTKSGSLLRISGSEFQLLSILCESAGAVVTRDSLLDALRGTDVVKGEAGGIAADPPANQSRRAILYLDGHVANPGSVRAGAA